MVSNINSFLQDSNKTHCTGCEACSNICPTASITMVQDHEGFFYPHINPESCVHCDLCIKLCIFNKEPKKHPPSKFVYGGHIKDDEVLGKSTSGGAFTALALTNADENTIIFGAKTSGLKVFHGYIVDTKDIGLLQKSKYQQSQIVQSYRDVKKFLKEGKKVIFSGTPCQIAGLYNCLPEQSPNLLTIEVICEGVPSPLYMKKYDEYFERKYNSSIKELDYRFKGRNKWDFQCEHVELCNGIQKTRDRWFNPFWSIWLQHLMSRPSCYKCPFVGKERVADITLGDLWGVHLYCPELYNSNRGASLIIANTEKGEEALRNAMPIIEGHELSLEAAVKYQSPLRKTIPDNPRRDEFITDLNGIMSYGDIVKKWAIRPSLKLLLSKYVWGNRQKVFVWNLKNKVSKKGEMK